MFFSFCLFVKLPQPMLSEMCRAEPCREDSAKKKMKRESSSLEVSQAARKDTAADRHLDSESRENKGGIVRGPSRQSPCIN